MIKPENNFFLFGMGHREKYLYKNGQLINIKTNTPSYSWNVIKEKFLYDRYMVVLWTENDKIVLIEENENGLYISDLHNDVRHNTICLASSHINLPDFEEYKYPQQLRILHHEILISFIDTTPVPNIYVYNKAWYRDGAMMALVLEKTGNIFLLKDWALSIKELYDRNNWNMCEPDNLGQLAYILSFFVDKNYPLVSEIVSEAKKISKSGILTGITDGGDHTIYSTLWLKFGLNKLGVDTSFIKLPKKFDSYARMFWMDRTEVERTTFFSNEYDERYPYLWWAVKHFENEPINDDMFKVQYPMSWESFASQAKYEKIEPLSKEYAKNSFSAPHSWHAAEMFMYLIEKR